MSFGNNKATSSFATFFPANIPSRPVKIRGIIPAHFPFGFRRGTKRFEQNRHYGNKSTDRRGIHGKEDETKE